MQESNQWREYCEAQPLRFIDRELFYHLIRVVRELATELHCKPTELVPIPNATTGLNAVIKSVIRSPGHGCFMLDIGYGAVKKLFQDVCGEAGAPLTIHAVPLEEMFGGDSVTDGGFYGDADRSIEDRIVDSVARALPEGTRLAVFDAVTSNTALVLPIK